MSTLLDTNVLSELLRSPPAPAVLAWFAEQPPESLFVSALTQAEMMLGARLLPAGKRRKTLEMALWRCSPRTSPAGSCPSTRRRPMPMSRSSLRDAKRVGPSPSSMHRSRPSRDGLAPAWPPETPTTSGTASLR